MKTFWISAIIVLFLAAAWIGFVTYACKDDWCFIFPWQKTQIINNVISPYSNEIRVTKPISNDLVKSPLTVLGEARGTWYFEASFPVRLFDANGKELSVIPAQAKGDWMTSEFVPFEATLSFGEPTTKTGTLVLQNDNPSGLTENAKEIKIPIIFSNYRTISSALFNKLLAISIGNNALFSDGLLINLKEINDSRCKPDVVCVWHGESSQEIRLGTVLNKNIDLKGYTFSLESATNDNAVLKVFKTFPVVGV